MYRGDLIHGGVLRGVREQPRTWEFTRKKGLGFRGGTASVAAAKVFFAGFEGQELGTAGR